VLGSAIVLSFRAWPWLSADEGESESDPGSASRCRARRKPGIKPWICGMGKCPGADVTGGQSNIDVGDSVEVRARVLVMKRVLVLRLWAGSLSIEVLVM
jgi:hypothetical protein